MSGTEGLQWLDLDLRTGFPGDDERFCCYGAVTGRECTCWRPVYNGEQQVVQIGPANIRSSMCDGCAFRGDSPERSGDPLAHHDYDDLQDLLDHDTPFYCHRGMRRLTHWEHPDGSVHAPEGADGFGYEPKIRSDGVPVKLDGTPADICSGWWKLRQQRKAEQVHWMTCRICDEPFDMRDLDQVFAHEHDGLHEATGILGRKVDHG